MIYDTRLIDEADEISFSFESVIDDIPYLDRITNIIDNSISKHKGINKLTAKVISTSIENYYNRYNIPIFRRHNCYSNECFNRSRYSIISANLALEGIKDIIMKIFEVIVEFILNIIEWFRKTFFTKASPANQQIDIIEKADALEVRINNLNGSERTDNSSNNNLNSNASNESYNVSLENNFQTTDIVMPENIRYLCYPNLNDITSSEMLKYFNDAYEFQKKIIGNFGSKEVVSIYETLMSNMDTVISSLKEASKARLEDENIRIETVKKTFQSIKPFGQSIAALEQEVSRIDKTFGTTEKAKALLTMPNGNMLELYPVTRGYGTNRRIEKIDIRESKAELSREPSSNRKLKVKSLDDLYKSVDILRNMANLAENINFDEGLIERLNKLLDTFNPDKIDELGKVNQYFFGGHLYSKFEVKEGKIENFANGEEKVALFLACFLDNNRGSDNGFSCELRSDGKYTEKFTHYSGPRSVWKFKGFYYGLSRPVAILMSGGKIIYSAYKGINYYTYSTLNSIIKKLEGK